MALNNAKLLDGPVPGENLTSDPRNQPWKRPPQHVTLDPALEDIMKTFKKRKNAQGILNMLSMGFTVSYIVDIILIKGIEKGKWSMDLALLLAGPISHMIVIIARTYDIKYEMGLEEGPPTYGKDYFNEVKKTITSQKQAEVDKAVEEEVSGSDISADMQEQETANTGFMSDIEGM